MTFKVVFLNILFEFTEFRLLSLLILVKKKCYQLVLLFHLKLKDLVVEATHSKLEFSFTVDIKSVLIIQYGLLIL